MDKMIPVKLEDLTLEFFQDSLKPSLGEKVEVSCVAVRPAFAVKKGHLATHWRATVVVAVPDEPKRLLNLFAKLIPLDDQFFMQLLAQMRYDVREVKFFKEFATALTAFLEPRCGWALPIPRLAFSKHTLEEPKSILVLHDASEDGYVARCLSVGWDLPHLLVAVRTLAKINGSSVAYMVTHGLDVKAMERKFPSLQLDFTGFEEAVLFHKQCIHDLQEELANFDEGRGDDEPELTARLDSAKTWTLETMMEFYGKALAGPFVAVAQRDCWNNNFLFKYDRATGDPVDAMLCDWQWASLFNVTADLACLLYTSVDADLRRRCLDMVLREYFRSFVFVVESLGARFDVTFESFVETFEEVGLRCAFESLKVLRIAFSRSNVHCPDNVIMRRFCAALREILRAKLW